MVGVDKRMVGEVGDIVIVVEDARKVVGGVETGVNEAQEGLLLPRWHCIRSSSSYSPRRHHPVLGRYTPQLNSRTTMVTAG